MLVAAAVLPHPPLLVPEVAAGAAAELAELRAGCDDAVAAVTGAAPGLVVVVGSGSADTEYPEGSVGSLHGYGVDLTVRLGRATEASTSAPRLPLAVTVGGWLLARAGWSGAAVGVSVTEGTTSEQAAALGRSLADRASRVGLLVMGDGSARMSEAAPGYVDLRAPGFAAEVAGALATGDPSRLLALDAELARQLLAAGRAPWQVLAGAIAPPVTARLLHHQAPYGVDYLIATWLPVARS